MFKQLEKDRSITSVYYILKGKPSIQTIQDAHLFHLDNYFAVYRTLRKQQFMDMVNWLEKKDYVQKRCSDFTITKKGHYFVEQHEPILQTYNMEGYRFKQIEVSFYKRLLLLVQVWTNAEQNNFTYIPIIEDKKIEDWVKHVYQKNKFKINTYLHSLFNELSAIFSTFHTESAIEIWVQQLTGYQRIGKTIYQLAQEYGLLAEDIYLMTTSVNHFLLNEIQKLPSSYPLLSFIATNHHSDVLLTASAQITYQMINQNYTLEEIAARRKLKLNTIYDHIVEVSLNDPEFMIDPYVEPTVQEEIYDVLQQVDSYKLKTIKDRVSHHISYFEIRLVLSKL